MALTGSKALQSWCQKVTAGYPNIKIENMTKSWKDGLAFCAIIHHFRPELIDFSTLSKKNIRENNTLAFEVAERELGIPALLDPEDMVTMTSPDKLSILTYLSQYYNCFKDKKPGGPPPLMNPSPEHNMESKDNGISEKGLEFKKRSLKKVKDKENKAAEVGPLPAKISMKSDKCEICLKRVYLVERQVVDGRLFHRNCFRCTKCRSTLRPDSYKLTKDPKKFECMCHSDGPDIWNLRMNITSRAGARLAGMDDGDSIWQSRPNKPATQQPEKIPEKLPPKESTTVKPANSVAISAETSMVSAPSTTSDKPPLPSTLPLHPHLLKSAARARFNAQGETSPVGSPELQRQQNGGSVASLTMGSDVSKSQESLDEPHTDSTARPIAKPRTVIKTEQSPISPSMQSPQVPQETSKDDKSALDSNNDGAAMNKIKKEVIFSSTDDETRDSSDVRSIQEGDSLGFDSSDLENVNKAITDSSQTETDEDTSADEPQSVKTTVTATSESKNLTVLKEEANDTQNLGESAEEAKKGEDHCNEINEALSKENIKDKLEISNNDVTNKSAEEGSSGDSALSDTKAELSDSLPDESAIARKPNEDSSLPLTEESSVSEGANIQKDETEIDKLKDVVSVANISSNSAEKTLHVEADGTDKGKERTDDNKVKKPHDDYDDSLNPFGSDEDFDEVEEQKESTLGPEKSESSNPFGNDYDESLNPFGDEEEDEEQECQVSDGSINPFTGSPIEETPLSRRLKDETRPGSFSHSKRPERPPPPILSSGSYSVKTRSEILDELKRDRETLKKKRAAPAPPSNASPTGVTAPSRSRKSRKAPPPPQEGPKRVKDEESPKQQENGKSLTPIPAPRGVAAANGAVDGNKGTPQPSQRMKKVHKPERPKVGPPAIPTSNISKTHHSSKRRAPAPPPTKRDVGKDHMDTSLIQQELVDIESTQRELELKGIELEKKLRQDTDDDAHHDDVMLIEWFDVVNQKNKLVRREGELIAQAQQQELELQHAEIEYELRVLLQKQEHERIDADAQREEQLLQMLVEVVTKRNQIVERLEEDRLREEAEDRDIEALMHSNHPDKKKDGGKEKKHKKKHLKLGLIK